MQSIHQTDWTLAEAQTPKPQIHPSWILTSKAKNLLCSLSLCSNTIFCISHSKPFLYVVPCPGKGNGNTHCWTMHFRPQQNKCYRPECPDTKVILEKMIDWLKIWFDRLFIRKVHRFRVTMAAFKQNNKPKCSAKPPIKQEKVVEYIKMAAYPFR